MPLRDGCQVLAPNSAKDFTRKPSRRDKGVQPRVSTLGTDEGAEDVFEFGETTP